MRIDVVQATVPARGGKLSDERIRAIHVAASSGTTIRIRVPSAGPRSISSVYEDSIAAVAVQREVRDAARDGADAIVVNCTADTGVEAARELVAIPVVGVMQAAFHLTAQLSDRFSVLTFASRISRRFEHMARLWGFETCLSSVRSVEIPLARNTDTGKLAKELAKAAGDCVAHDGAQAVILGCTDFELAAPAMDKHLQKLGIEVPLIRPFEVGLGLAESLVRMRLSHSKLTYPTPDTIEQDRGHDDH